MSFTKDIILENPQNILLNAQLKLLYDKDVIQRCVNYWFYRVGDMFKKKNFSSFYELRFIMYLIMVKHFCKILKQNFKILYLG